MRNYVMPLQIISWVFGILVLVVGVLNIVLVHPVPGIVYLLLSLVYLPPATAWFRQKLGFQIPIVVKLILGIVIFMFTLGVSDLGDMIDKL
ncbi:hypothetical protein [Pontibacter vulgaris]|uniref:hypothetical protein n=1 Tax=Pontibacter vulgaris TaxID=2905679 RepID=UPI001FA808A0|nr:hypothetical protein [Pontibacter vulgaris]